MSEKSDEVASAAEPTSNSLTPHVLAGVAGRVGAETFKSPFDLLKVRRQYDLQLQSRPLPLALYSVMRTEGLSAYRGLPPRLIWSAPLAGATFTYYQVLKSETGGNEEGATQNKLSMKTVLGGPLVLMLSVAMRTPFDIVEQQLQLENARPPAAAAATAPPSHAPPPLSPTPRAIFAKIHETWLSEGARGVWRGYPAAFGGIGTYIAGYFVFYEAARRAMLRPGCPARLGGAVDVQKALLVEPREGRRLRAAHAFDDGGRARVESRVRPL